MSQNFSLHEHYRDDEPTAGGSNRAFGCTVGGIVMVIGAVKAFIAGAVTPVSLGIVAVGAVLVFVGVIAPARLSTLNRLWLKLGILISKLINPIVLGLLFYLAVTPMALVMRMAGKRPLRLASDRTAASYWIKREPPEAGPSGMRRQF